MAVCATGLFAAGCGEDGATEIDTRPSVRFFNAVWNAPDGIGFTTNAQFVAGSALGYAQSTQTCTRITPGNTTFGIGIANAGGTGLSSDVLASLLNQPITDGGNYTVLAGGNVIHPSVVMLDNSLAGPLGTNQAAVRFVNLAATSEFPFTILKGTLGTGATSIVQTDLAFRAATPFSTVASGSNPYAILYNHEVAIGDSESTLNLQAGSINTVVIVRDPATNNFQLKNVASCS